MLKIKSHGAKKVSAAVIKEANQSREHVFGHIYRYTLLREGRRVEEMLIRIKVEAINKDNERFR